MIEHQPNPTTLASLNDQFLPSSSPFLSPQNSTRVQAKHEHQSKLTTRISLKHQTKAEQPHIKIHPTKSKNKPCKSRAVQNKGTPYSRGPHNSPPLELSQLQNPKTKNTTSVSKRHISPHSFTLTFHYLSLPVRLSVSESVTDNDFATWHAVR